jgi:hypothetical protein
MFTFPSNETTLDLFFVCTAVSLSHAITFTGNHVQAGRVDRVDRKIIYWITFKPVMTIFPDHSGVLLFKE